MTDKNTEKKIEEVVERIEYAVLGEGHSFDVAVGKDIIKIICEVIQSNRESVLDEVEKILNKYYNDISPDIVGEILSEMQRKI